MFLIVESSHYYQNSLRIETNQILWQKVLYTRVFQDWCNVTMIMSNKYEQLGTTSALSDLSVIKDFLLAAMLFNI